MKVILLQDIHKLGKKHEIKEVSDGYAKNFLIPRGLTELATATRTKNLELRTKNEEKKHKEKQSLIETLAVELERHPLEFKVKTGKKGELFASIGGKEIEAEFRKKGLDIKVDLEKPFKALGEHHVEIDLGFGKKKKIGVHIVAEK